MPTLQSILKPPFRLLRDIYDKARHTEPSPPPQHPMTELHIVVEETPNPDARKFSCGVSVVEQGSIVAHASDASIQSDHPSLAPLLAISGVQMIFATRDFVTITRKDQRADWAQITPDVIAVLQQTLPR